MGDAQQHPLFFFFPETFFEDLLADAFPYLPPGAEAAIVEAAFPA
jgi:hypothetical protein